MLVVLSSSIPLHICCDIIYECPFRTHSHLIWLLAGVIWQQVMTLSLNNLSSISLLLPTPHMLGGADLLKPVHNCVFDLKTNKHKYCFLPKDSRKYFSGHVM